MFHNCKFWHDVQLSDHLNGTFSSRSNWILHVVGSEVALGDIPALLHGTLVQFPVVVGLGHILGLCLTLVVEEGRVVVRDALVIFDVAKDVEEVLVIFLSVLELLGQIVFHVAVGAALTRSVGLVLLGPHGHDVLDALLDYGTIDVVNTQDELEKFAELLFRLREDILEAEEVDGLLRVLGNIEPVLEPLVVAMSAAFLPSLPVAEDGLLKERVLEVGAMALSEG